MKILILAGIANYACGESSSLKMLKSNRCQSKPVARLYELALVSGKKQPGFKQYPPF